MKRLLIIFAGLVFAVSAQAASFDCAKAATNEAGYEYSFNRGAV